MLRKLTVMFLLSFFIIALMGATTVFAADKQIKRIKERAIVPARFAPIYSMDGAQDGGGESFASPPKGGNQISLGQTTAGVSTVVGVTSYDQQHNATAGRQIAHRGTGYLHVDWMWRIDNIFGGSGRGTYTQAHDLSVCPYPDGAIYPLGGVRADAGNRSGYVALDVDQTGCGIPVAHENNGGYAPYTYYDLCTGTPFGIYAGDAPTDVFGGWDPPGANENLWPKVAWQIGTETVLHLVATEASADVNASAQTTSYYRRVGGYGQFAGVWSNQKLIDTITNLSTTISAQYMGDKVAIAWSAPADNMLRDSVGEFEPILYTQIACDVWYAISTTQGADWMAGSGSIGHQVDQGSGAGFLAGVGGNVTTYPYFDILTHPTPSYMYTAYADLSCLVTGDGNFHILWNCFQWANVDTLYRRNSAIFHWSEDNTTPSLVVRADWDTGGVCFAQAWAMDVAKMSISECDNKLYAVYTQFGSAAEPCDDNAGDSSLTNGYLYMSVSDDDGENWDRGQKLTSVVNPIPCTPSTWAGSMGGTPDGDCNSEYWSTAARFGRVAECGDNASANVLDIVYINDYAPGGAMRTESGVWTLNPVIWLETPCRDVVLEALYSDDGPDAYGENNGGDPLVVGINSFETDIITITNGGLLQNNIVITFTYVDGDAWMTAVPPGGVVPCCGGQMDVGFAFTAPGGAPDPSAWSGTIEISNDAVDNPSRSIPVTMLVASEFTFPESAVLATACKRIRIYNTGELGNNAGDAALDFIDDCDTFNVNTTSNIYLYDGSPIVARIDGNGDTLVFNMYSKLFTDDDALRPMDSLTVDSSGSDYTYASGEFATADSAIGFIVEYYVPMSSDSCEFIIERLKWFNRTVDPIGGVLIGEFIDWDVPSDSGSNNGSGFDAPRNMMYQFGGEYNQDDSTEAFCPQESKDRYAGIALYIGGEAPKNAMTLDNPTYVYVTTSPHLDPPLSYDKMYEAMELDNYIPYSSSAPESLYTDLSTLMTFGQYDLAVGDTACVVKILATSKTGLTDLQLAIDKANAFIDNHGLACALPCDCLPGDANEDGGQNVGDAVYLINFVFKGGPAPLPYATCSGDANGDCGSNVGDAVYLINFVFKGGPEPVTCEFYRDEGGPLNEGCGNPQ